VKNANIFVDVDLTLVDANGRLLAGAGEALQRLKQAGCHLFLWSTAGAEYARSVAARHQLTDLFEGFAAKPDIVIDDMPSTTTSPFVFNVQEESSWKVLCDKIIAKHIG
jgi:phosphoglycolate phosphatase-like HAD superfamily hydrolase